MKFLKSILIGTILTSSICANNDPFAPISSDAGQEIYQMNILKYKNSKERNEGYHFTSCYTTKQSPFKTDQL